MFPHLANSMDMEMLKTFTKTRDVDVPAPSAAAITLELTRIATHMAQLDAVLVQMGSSSCKMDEEANRWQQISLITVEWSKKMLVRQQEQCLQRLKKAVGTPPGLEQSGHLSAKPQDASSCPPTAWPITSAVGSQHQDFQQGPGPPGLQVSQQPHVPVTMSASSASVMEVKPQGTLRTHLEELRDEDAECILIVRRINRLGFQSSDLLSEYFEKFGGAGRILVAHLRVKPSSRRPTPRIRPAGLGFVVMKSGEDVLRVMKESTHQIGDVVIAIEQYRTDRRFSELEVQDVGAE